MTLNCALVFTLSLPLPLALLAFFLHQCLSHYVPNSSLFLYPILHLFLNSHLSNTLPLFPYFCQFHSIHIAPLSHSLLLTCLFLSPSSSSGPFSFTCLLRVNEHLRLSPRASNHAGAGLVECKLECECIHVC